MAVFADFEPAMFGAWAGAPAYDGLAAGEREDAALLDGVSRVLLETKSCEAPAEDLRRLLNDMTREMRAQFDYFRDLRGAAERLAGADSDDAAAAKLARADVKAATDAMSLIVRTLEKIDTLQRQLAHDRQMEAERNVDVDGLAEARTHFLQLIDQRVKTDAEAMLERFKRDWLAARDPPDDGASPSQQQDAAQDGGDRTDVVEGPDGP